MSDENSQANCIFCKIVAKKIPAAFVSEGENFVAIRDINPQAPTHVLVLPKNHKGNITAMEDPTELGQLFQAACQVAKSEKLERGFRLIVNTGAQSGQTVNHLHIHVLGGRSMRWPPG